MSLPADILERRSMTLTLTDNPTVMALAKALEPLSDEMLAWDFGRRVTWEARGFSEREIGEFGRRAFEAEEARRAEPAS